MLAKALTCAVVGLEGAIVEVEVDISAGLPAFNIVGLPDTAVQEAKERVRSAIRNSGCVFPMKRITVSLAPADLKKEGPNLPTGTPTVGLLGRPGFGRADLRPLAPRFDPCKFSPPNWQLQGRELWQTGARIRRYR